VGTREIGLPICGSRFAKFPVFFPVSREFSGERLAPDWPLHDLLASICAAFVNIFKYLRVSPFCFVQPSCILTHTVIVALHSPPALSWLNGTPAGGSRRAGETLGNAVGFLSAAQCETMEASTWRLIPAPTSRILFPNLTDRLFDQRCNSSWLRTGNWIVSTGEWNPTDLGSGLDHDFFPFRRTCCSRLMWSTIRKRSKGDCECNRDISPSTRWV